jgi:hypothetical protein
VKQLLLWIRGHKLSTAGLVLVILGCVALVNLSRRVHHLKPRPALAASAADAAAAASRQDVAEPPAPSVALRAQFETAASYLDFIGQALQRPQEGGGFYALLARRRCERLQRTAGAAGEPTGSAAFHDAARARVADLRERCAGVIDAYPDAAALYGRALERGAGDPLLPPGGRGFAAPATRAMADADLDAALKTGDPWAAAETLRANAGLLDAGNSTGDAAVDRQLREWAGQVVACELVDACRLGIEASLHCVNTGDCTQEDDRDLVLAQVPDAQRIIFDTVLAALRQRMAPIRADGGNKS